MRMISSVYRSVADGSFSEWKTEILHVTLGVNFCFSGTYGRWNYSPGALPEVGALSNNLEHEPLVEEVPFIRRLVS